MPAIVNGITIRVLALSPDEVEIEILSSEVKGPLYLGDLESETITLKILESHRII